MSSYGASPLARKYARDSGFILDEPEAMRVEADPDLETPGEEVDPTEAEADAILQAILRCIASRERLSSIGGSPTAIASLDRWIVQAGRAYGELTGERPPMIGTDVEI
jgi:hypothetical protein